jgi:hypothetical protein
MAESNDMSNFRIPTIGTNPSENERAVYRVELTNALDYWQANGRPRDAVELNALTAVIETVGAMAWQSTSTAESERVAELVARLADASAYLADADATRVAPTFAAPDAPADVHAECVERAERMEERLHRAESNITDASDNRLAPIWERAHEIADARGHCETFDELMEELGAPSRMVDVTVTVTGTYTASVPASDLNNDWRDACGEAMDCCSIDWEVSSYERD